MQSIEIIRCDNSNIAYFRPLLFDYVPSKGAVVIGAVREGIACGVSVLSWEQNSVRIEYFFVAEPKRRQRIGTKLMNTLLDMLEGKAAYVSIDYGDDEEHLHEFLGQSGFVRTKRADAYEIPFCTPDLLQKSWEESILRKYAAGYCTSAVLYDAEKTLEKLGCGILIYRKDLYDERYSFILTGKQEEIEGILLCNREKGCLYIEYLYGKTPKQVVYLLQLLFSRIRSTGEDFRCIRFLAQNPASIKLVGVLAPGIHANKIFSIYYGVYEY